MTGTSNLSSSTQFRERLATVRPSEALVILGWLKGQSDQGAGTALGMRRQIVSNHKASIKRQVGVAGPELAALINERPDRAELVAELEALADQFNPKRGPKRAPSQMDLILEKRKFNEGE